MGRLQNNPFNWMGALKIYTCPSTNLGQKQKVLNKRWVKYFLPLVGMQEVGKIFFTISRDARRDTKMSMDILLGNPP
jgi:hypothetical protein